MHSHEILREVSRQTSAKQIASEMGLSLSMVYKWAEPPDSSEGSGAANPLDRVIVLQKCSSDDRIIQWVCQKAGGFFIANPKTQHPHPDCLIPATNQILQEFADLLAVIAAASGDNRISGEEAEAIRARWEALKSVTEGFVSSCEQGNFEPPPALQMSARKPLSPSE